MRDAFAGRYRPTEEELTRLWGEGLFVFDANVILHLYRYSETARREMLSVIRALGERAWLPHQAAEEFLARRLDVMQSRKEKYRDVSSRIGKARAQVEDAMRELHRDRAVEAEDLLDTARNALDGLVEHLGEGAKALPAESNAPEDDAVWREVEEAFGERIGAPFEQERLEEIFADGKRRYEMRIPPGYKDEGKGRDAGTGGVGDRRYGDLVLWKQTLEKARDAGLPVVLVTDDRKEDWWWISHNKTVGPRPELVEEMRSFASVPFHMYRPASLVVEAGKRGLIGAAESAGAADEIEGLGSLDEALPARKSQLDLLQALASETWGERGVEVVQAAAGKPLDRMSRADADRWIDTLTEDPGDSMGRLGGNLAVPDEGPISARPGEISYPELRRAGVPLSGYVDRLLADLRSQSFDRQNNAATALNNVTRKGELFALPTALQEELGRALIAAAEGIGSHGSFGAQKLLSTIGWSPGGWPEGFVAGLLSGALVNEAGRFDVKAGHANDALKIAVSHPSADVVLPRVEQAVDASHTPETSSEFATTDGNFDDFEFAASMVEEAKEDAPERAPALDALAAAVREAAPAQDEGRDGGG